jgi:hypothetical protein
MQLAAFQPPPLAHLLHIERAVALAAALCSVTAVGWPLAAAGRQPATDGVC